MSREINSIHMKIFMTYLGATIIASFILVSCGQNNDKQKELELKERELALKERELALKEKDTSVAIQKESQPSLKETAKLSNEAIISGKAPTIEVEKKCDSKYQFSGKLIGVFNYGMPCAYPYLKIFSDEGKSINLFLDGNLDNFKINNQKFFKWSDNKINNFLENDESSSGQFPSDAIDVSYLNKKFLFCCYKQRLECGDDPNSPKDYFCKQILSQ